MTRPFNERTGFGRRLFELRTRAGLTVQQASDQVGCSKGFWSQMENGRTMPSIQSVKSIVSTMVINGHVGWTAKSLRESLEVMASLLDLELPSNPLSSVTGLGDGEYNGHGQAGIRSVFISAAQLLENDHPGFLERTVKNINHGIRHTLFLPAGEAGNEWSKFQHQAEAVDDGSSRRLRSGVTIIACPPENCYPEVRIYNPAHHDVSGVVTVSTVDRMARFQPLLPDHARVIGSRLSHIRENVVREGRWNGYLLVAK